jgi:hypothetical protein
MTSTTPTQTMKKKITKALVWNLTNIVELFLIYQWIFNDVYWAGNLIKFWIVFIFICTLAVISSPEAVKRQREIGRSVPKILAYISYILSIALIVSQGHFVFGALYTLSACFEIYNFDGTD